VIGQKLATTFPLTMEHKVGSWRKTLRRFVKQVGRGLLGGFFLSLLALSILMTVLPADGDVKRHHRTGRKISRFPSWMFDYRDSMMAEVEQSVAAQDIVAMVAISVKYSVLLPVFFWKECVIAISLYWVFPRLRGALYTFMPDWVDEFSNKVTTIFSQDDNEPLPALEVDESVRRMRGDASRTGAAESFLFSPYSSPRTPHPEPPSTPCSSSSISSSSSSSSSSKVRYYNGTEIDADDWYVFDPVYGVIPMARRDLWNKQLREMEVRREASIMRGRETKIKPVRFSSVTEGDCDGVCLGELGSFF